jgi:ankyrin repeat protein
MNFKCKDGTLLVLKTYDGHEIELDCEIAAKHSEYLSILMEDAETQSSLTIHLSNPCCASQSVSNAVSYMAFASSQPESQNEAWSAPEGMRDSGELLRTTLAAVFLDMKGLLRCLAKIPLILHLTVQAGEADATAALIEAKADVNEKDADGNTALDLASDRHCRDILLLSSGWTPLMIAAKEGSSPDLIFEIAITADINAANLDGATALHFAASGGHTKTVQALMEARASVHVRTKVTCGRLFSPGD